jgi:nitroreductase
VTTYPTIPLSTYKEYPIEEMRQRLGDFYRTVNDRRTVREFSDRPVPRDIIEDALRAAGTAPSGTNKPFLETAPYLIAVFLQKFGYLPDGRKVKHYYPVESTGIATGILITALHMAGLVCLTHTPSPMKFLNEILDRPKSDRPFLLLVTGYPADDAMIPDIQRKPLEDFVSFVDACITKLVLFRTSGRFRP